MVLKANILEGRPRLQHISGNNTGNGQATDGVLGGTSSDGRYGIGTVSGKRSLGRHGRGLRSTSRGAGRSLSGRRSTLVGGKGEAGLSVNDALLPVSENQGWWLRSGLHSSHKLPCQSPL